MEDCILFMPCLNINSLHTVSRPRLNLLLVTFQIIPLPKYTAQVLQRYIKVCYDHGVIPHSPTAVISSYHYHCVSQKSSLWIGFFMINIVLRKQNIKKKQTNQKKEKKHCRV